MKDDDFPELGRCNSCGEERELYGEECCIDGEIVPVDDVAFD